MTQPRGGDAFLLSLKQPTAGVSWSACVLGCGIFPKPSNQPSNIMNTDLARRPCVASARARRASLLFAALTVLAAWPGYAAEIPKLNVEENAVTRTAHYTPSFAPIVKRVSPNVVNVYTTKTMRENPRSSWLDDPLFRQFFGRGVPGDGDDRSRPREYREQGLGSGVIISEDGYILTNNHVVEDADEVRVVFADGQKELKAKVIGTDPQTDIAVIKVDGEHLPTITVTDSDKLEVGDVVLAVGNPFGVGQTVTSGIVSAKSRGGMGIVDYEDFIQTDASINPGNSGGPLVDAEGRLVGINTAILSRSGGNQGIGFAVPINLVRNVMEQLISVGKVTRGFLGIGIQPITPDLAQAFGITQHQGALVSEITPRSPAAAAGLKEGDVITEFNSKQVTDSRQLRLMVSQTPPGTSATLRVLRDGKPKTLTATLGELPKDRQMASNRRTQPGQNKAESLRGVTVVDLDSRFRQQLNVPEHVQGALVTEVDPDSDAASAGLEAGDVILEINRVPVTKADEAIEQSERAKGDRILLRVWSRSGTHYLAVESGKKAK